MKFAINNKELKTKLPKLITKKFVSDILRPALITLSPRIGEFLKESFRNTIVYKGMSDRELNSDSDVRAHLGLTIEEAATFIETVEELLEQSVKIGPIKTTGKRIQFSILSLNLITLMKNNINGSYVSENGFDIEWLSWLLDGNSDVDAGIIFDFDFENFSRSGRAIMIYNNNIWEITDYNQFSRTGNFVLDILNDDALSLNIIKSLQEIL